MEHNSEHGWHMVVSFDLSPLCFTEALQRGESHNDHFEAHSHAFGLWKGAKARLPITHSETRGPVCPSRGDLGIMKHSLQT
jgi:hypothetical protein